MHLTGRLLYLTTTRLDIIFIPCLLSQFLKNSTINHYKIVKGTLRYLKWCLSQGLFFLGDYSLQLIDFFRCWLSWLCWKSKIYLRPMFLPYQVPHLDHPLKSSNVLLLQQLVKCNGWSISFKTFKFHASNHMFYISTISTPFTFQSITCFMKEPNIWRLIVIFF